ncbi:MAG: CvpA family protein [Alphaproteobacteria bacterium]|nr:MAG: CvpA family protein [Alphaproteobacteria bacterium]
MLNSFDIAVALLLLISVLVAFSRGMTAMLLSLAAWGGAVLVTLVAWQTVAGWMHPWFADPALADFLAAPALFVVSLVILKLLARMIARSVRDGPLGLLDCSLGALFGLVFGLLVASSIWLLLDGMVWKGHRPKTVENSQARPILVYGAAMLARIGPDFLSRIEAENEHPALIDRLRRESRGLPEDLEQLARRVKNGETGYPDDARRELDRILEAMPSASHEGEGTKKPQQKKKGGAN